MEKERCFVYARLHDPRIQKEITGRPWEIPEGNTIIGYKKTTMMWDGTEYPVILRHAPSKVHGFVYDLTMEEVEKVDAFLPKAYERRKHKVETGEEVWIWFKDEKAFEDLEEDNQ